MNILASQLDLDHPGGHIGGKEGNEGMAGLLNERDGGKDCLFVRHLSHFQRYSDFMDSVDATGWLPYDSVSIQLVEACAGDTSLLDRRLSEFYRKNWNRIQQEMELRLVTCPISEESKETFREALIAHREGLHRCVCRLLFPEMERILRECVFEDKAGRIGSKKLLESFANRGSLEDFLPKKAHGLILFGRLVEHIYEGVTDSNREGYIRDSVPNRHAVVHGLVPYSTYKHSLNMLILADYIFRVISDNYSPDLNDGLQD